MERFIFLPIGFNQCFTNSKGVLGVCNLAHRALPRRHHVAVSNWRWISGTAWLPLVLAILCLSIPYVGHAQVTATLSERSKTRPAA